MAQNRLWFPRPEFKKQTWWQRNRVLILSMLAGILAVNSIFISKLFRGDAVDIEKVGVFGDFVGGYIGTILSLIGVGFLYYTLKDQREASATETRQIKYFELLKMHRDNVAEIGIGNSYGRRVFVLLIREFREILLVTHSVACQLNLTYSKEEIFIISYYALFFGAGPNSSRMLKAALKDYNPSFVDLFESTLNNKKG